jgi:dTDP-4-dehydrorhamnose reductase
VERPARCRPLEHPIADPLGTGSRHLITGAGGQLGEALREVFPEADARTRQLFDVTSTVPVDPKPDLVLHAAAWTDVDGAEDRPHIAETVNVRGTKNVVELGAPVVYFSTDYVFDGAKREPYVESDEPRPLSVYGRTKLDGEHEVCEGWIIRSSWLFGWTGTNFVRTMLRLGAERDEVAVVSDQTGSPTYVGHLAKAEFARAIFEEAGVDCRVREITTAELGRPAPRPAYSVLRSEREGAPRLPHWREGLRACLTRL